LPSPQIGVQTLGGDGGLLIQVNSGSTIQVLLHPSALLVFPSSQASLDIITPSPQTVPQVEAVLIDPDVHE